ncbi:MAG: YkgJ family cysteine cluster protein [Nannocystaceae bacterium]|nr:YkgJ family cysteine cluster protein [bacterium]
MVAEVPARPRLADHVLARRHVSGGREFVILHDEARGETLELEAAAWAVLSCADGTRDVEGIIAAATRLGARTTASVVGELLAALAERDALVDGAPDHEPDVVRIRTRPARVLDEPVVALPGFRYACDGTGGCCRSYGSVLLTPGDRDRARAALPEHAIAGVPMTRWFTPDRGSAPTPLSVPVTVDGGCGFLGTDGLCEIHRKVGLEGKPRACSAFPVTACSDGVEVRVSAMPECACVLRPVEEGEGDPLGEGWQRGADVPPMLIIDTLPESIRVDASRTESPAWLRAAVSRTLRALTEAADLAQTCWQHADAWSRPKEASLGAYVEALGRKAKDAMRRRSTYVAADDWVLASMQWLVGTLHFLGEPALQAAAMEPTQATDAVELRYLQCVLWGYHGFGSRAAVDVMREHAIKIWIARAMAEVPLAPSTHAIPLATLNMLLRGHALSRAWES